ncbi:allophanate hydrolase [Solimonas soli]|uniref:allophanate hydrolase n=1 Tax=Solimonas soli TaxID=413479 RepID=UPI0004B01368
MAFPKKLDLATLQALYASGRATPLDVVDEVLRRCDAYAALDPAVWIGRADADALRDEARALIVAGRRADQPLWGVPFAAKDNIDCRGIDTTAACPEFAYRPSDDATVVARLRAAGALLVGKTNLDQFATGLNGTRSPYGAPRSVYSREHVSGGSSSGSAVAVAAGLVAFSLGTDTAGSGRVPAAFNGLVGLKPTRGWLSTRGVVPACRSLDCVSVFANSVTDAERIADVAGAYDAGDAYSRRAPAAPAARLPRRFGVPAAPRFFGDAQAEQAWQRVCAQAREGGAELLPLDFEVLHDIAALLYDGPWVAERLAATEDFLREHADAMHPVVRAIVEQGRKYSAVDAFRAEYRLRELKPRAEALMASVDALLVPTAPSMPTVAQLLADPVQPNSELGTYTNFVNLLDWSALAVPAGLRDDGLPFGITLIGPAWADRALAAFGRRWLRESPEQAAGAKPMSVHEPAADHVRLAVVGAHLRGMPLNRELGERDAIFVETTHTSSDYRLYALANTQPPKPGLAKTGDGAPIEVELWDVPLSAFGSFVAGVPAPLGIGTLTLADGRTVKGFICEGWALADALDITAHGGWRAYRASLAPPA